MTPLPRFAPDITVHQSPPRWSDRPSFALRAMVRAGQTAILAAALSLGLAAEAIAQTAREYREGDSGVAVERIQRALGIRVTGIYGTETARAVEDFQSRNRLNCVDSISGPETLTHLGLDDLVEGTNRCFELYLAGVRSNGQWSNNPDGNDNWNNNWNDDWDDDWTAQRPGSGRICDEGFDRGSLRDPFVDDRVFQRRVNPNAPFSDALAPFVVAVPGQNRSDLRRAQDATSDAFIDFNSSRFGPFIRAGTFADRGLAERRSTCLRRIGLDARVIYGPLGR